MGLRNSNWEVGPGVRGASRPREPPALGRVSAAPDSLGGGANVENERRLKADGAQDCSVYAFFGSSCLSTETGCRWLGEAL